MEAPQPQGISKAESKTTFKPGYQEGNDPNLIAHQQNPDPVLNPLKNTWLGYSFQGVNENGIEIWNKSFPPIMTEQGANRIISEIRPRFNHFACLSNLTEEEIAQFKEECEHTVNELLFDQAEAWEVKQSDKDSIINMVGQMVKIGLNRAKNQGERVFLSKTLETKQIFQEKEKQKKKMLGILPKI